MSTITIYYQLQKIGGLAYLYVRFTCSCKLQGALTYLLYLLTYLSSKYHMYYLCLVSQYRSVEHPQTAAAQCVIRKADFLSSNALTISWDTSLNVDEAAGCQLRLVQVTDHSLTSTTSCTGQTVLRRFLPATHSVRFILF